MHFTLILSRTSIPATILEESNLDYYFPTSFNSMFLTSRDWIANLSSVISSSYPSFHKVWQKDSQSISKFNINQVMLPEVLKKFGFYTVFQSNIPAIFDSLSSFFDNISEDLFNSAHLGKEKSFQLILINKWDHHMINDLYDFLEKLRLQTNTISILTQLVSEFPNFNVPFYVQIPNNKIKSKNLSNALHSIVDIAPSVISWLNLKRPYPWVGFEIPRKEPCVLIEETPNVRILRTPSYLIRIDSEEEKGKIFKIYGNSLDERNLWDDTKFLSIKNQLLLELAWTQLGKEPMPMPRIAGA